MRQGDVIYPMLKKKLTKADILSWWVGDLFVALVDGMRSKRRWNLPGLSSLLLPVVRNFTGRRRVNELKASSE